MTNKTHIWFIVNPISGTTDKKHILDLIPEYLTRERFTYEIKFTSHRGHAAEYAEEAISEGVNVVVAVGGDGTVNEVARSLIHTQTALGIVPCGSGNGLARHLYIPTYPEGALQVLAECHVESLDYGCINDTPFFCTCGVGFDAIVSSKFAQSGRRGLLTYIENTLREGLNYKPDTYEIEIDGEKQTFKAFLIACANASQYGNNVYIAPHASMSDGLMDVTIMEPFNVLEAPQIAIQLFNKTITQNSHIKSFRCSHLKIHRSTAGVIHYDGDPQMEGPDIDVKLIPHDIRVVVNTKEQPFQSAMMQTFGDLYNKMNANLMRDFREGRNRIKSINQDLLKILKPKP